MTRSQGKGKRKHEERSSKERKYTVHRSEAKRQKNMLSGTAMMTEGSFLGVG